MLLLVLYITVALLFSFLCSVAEAVLLSIGQPYIASLVKKNKRTGFLFQNLKRRVDRPLAAILTLNTIAHTVGAAGAGAQAAVVFGNAYVGLASAILTLLILIFSEIIPKTLGATYWRQLAASVARFLMALVWILYPFVILSEKITQSISHGSTLKGFSREEFVAMADLGAREGQLAMKESRILKNLFLLSSTNIKTIMTPRTVVFTLQEELSVEESVQEVERMPFSRIPIYRQNRDDIKEFVLKSDILLAQARGQGETQLKAFRRPLSAVPNSNTIFQLFEFMLDRREHIVQVVDEHGGMEGIVTLEDVVETLFGLEIVDESDKTVDMQALARSLWERRAQKMGIQLNTEITSSKRNDPEQDWKE
jgi:CBS domain containing-hemolysin-like protein